MEYSETAKKARAAYMRLYRLKNFEKMRLANIRYWQKRGELMEQQQQLQTENVK